MDQKIASSLRAIIGLDAATCAIMAAVLISAGGLLSAILSIPHSLLLGAGIVLTPVALFMAFVARIDPISRWGVWVVIWGNVGWVIASIGLLAGSFIEPTALGVAFILVQAAVVTALAAAEYNSFIKLARSMEPQT